MFKRYPYQGWLLLSILLWCLAGYRYYVGTRALLPSNMAHVIEKDLNRKEEQFRQLLKDEDLVKRMVSEKLTENEVEKLTGLPYHIYAYENEALIFWNNNKILADCNYTIGNDKNNLLNSDRGFYLRKCITPSYIDKRKKLTILFPVLVSYPINNSYLQSHFAAGSYIPVDTRILTRPAANSYEVKSIDGRTKFYLVFSGNNIPYWQPDNVMIGLLVLAMLFTIGWIHLLTIYLTRNKSYWVGFSLTVLLVFFLRIATYLFGLPFNLENLPIFSPQLYASSAILKSLGDVLLNVLCLLWIVIFVLRHVPFRFFEKLKLNVTARISIAIFLTLLMYIYAFGFVNVISSLVLDSRLSFDVSHFYAITGYTIFGLFTIGIIIGVSCLIIYLFNVQLATLIPVKWLRYIIIVLIGLMLTLFSEKANTGAFSYFLLLWFLFFIVLLDIKKLTNVTDLFAPHMIFWGIFVCAFGTAILLYFNDIKEHETRKVFAEQIIQQRDYVTEYAFNNVAQGIQRDRSIKLFIGQPTTERRRAINERFDALYLGGQLNKYQSRVLFFDAEGRNLYNSDTISYRGLLRQIKKSEPVSDSTLFYKENVQDGHYYIAYIPIDGDTTGKKIGYVFIDLAIKESTGESVYPELLQPENVKTNSNEAGYAYGIYINNRLITQTNDYPFAVYLQDTARGTYTFYEYHGISELLYREGKTKTVIVVHTFRVWLESISLFSYLFGIQLFIIVLMVLYRSFLSYFGKPRFHGKLINLTLRRRIHFSMLFIVLVSFFVIGVATIMFFTFQYRESNKDKLQRIMQVVERSTLLYLQSQNALRNRNTFNAETGTASFRYFIANLAKTQKVDINVFNGSGILNVTSQENIYDKSLIARIMRQDAYYQLYYLTKSLVVQNESIGSLSYLSSYVPLRDENGSTLGYINVPFFASEKELRFQISNILVALINLYAFLFLFSSVLTVFVTGWITRTLSIVTGRFEKISLTENELIEWPYDDEIGLMVREYNTMVKKVEQNALLLAQSEREGAWREMARQVAHEIKNPLTPMKLNIQYLQQALKNKYPNVEELAAKVSESLIEQIDNLSYIASEFSNFAKMPEARPEDFDLNELLEKTMELYMNAHNVDINFIKYPQSLVVRTDKSQLIRVFNNLLENAVQSIPDGRKGIVDVALNKEDGHATISVKDNGAGIGKDVIERIFQPYFTTKSSGTGLGLAMTKKIIEFWNGRIWFDTEEGIGTTFYISLPLKNHNNK